MPVAYSNLPIVKGTIRADSVAHLIEDLDVLVTRAGWTTKTTITSGFKYTLHRPRDFSLLSRICGVILVPEGVPSCDKGRFP